MGDRDSYCALCSAPLSTNSVKYGSDDETVLKERRRRVAWEKKKVAGRRHERDDDSISRVSSRDGDADEDIFDWEEQNKYDPDMFDPRDVAWMDFCRVLGFNSSASGVTKAFISGQGCQQDPGYFTVNSPGGDPNDPGGDVCLMYHEYNEECLPGYPFHETCYDLLAKRLGYADKQQIDKDVLYSVMSQKSRGFGGALDVNYGSIAGAEQYWNCVSGFEYVVTDPGPSPGHSDWFLSLMPANLFTEPSEPLDLGHKVLNDPLSVLPYDVILSITEYLPVHSVHKLSRASWHVFTLTRQDTFWRSLTHRHILPWLWELPDLFDDTTQASYPTSKNAKNVFLWWNESTRGGFGCEGPLMCLANRRRIWEACGELAVDYQRIMDTWKIVVSDNEEAKDILKNAVCLHMPVVMYPHAHAQGAHTIATQFIDSWTDLGDRFCQLDTYWTPSQMLTGISISFGKEKRVFGVAKGEKGCEVKMAPGEWIREVRVGTRKVDLPDERAKRLDTEHTEQSAITHMTVVLTSGRHVTVQSCEWHNTRALTVLPGMHLVGLTGQVALNGVISGLGLLQAPRQGQEPSDEPRYTAMQKTLYSNATINDSVQMTGKMPWERSDIRVKQSAYHERETSGHRHMMPHELFLWAVNVDEYKRLTRITCFQPVGGRVHGGADVFDVPHIVGFLAEYTSEQNAADVFNVPDIFGFLAERTPGQSSPKVAGSGGPVFSQDKRWNDGLVSSLAELNLDEQFQSFDEGSVVHFDIDGPGGEIVTEVHISHDLKAIKLRTNRQRECFFGEERRSSWKVERAAPGEMIVGLSLSFGLAGGWNYRANRHSHWRMTEVGVLVSTVDG